MVKIGVGIGVVLLTLTHALLIAGSCVIMHFRSGDDVVPGWTPQAASGGPSGWHPNQPAISGPAYNPAPVNEAAAGELKQQCAPCNQVPRRTTNWQHSNPFNLKPGELLLSVDPVLRSPSQHAPAIPAAPATPYMTPTSDQTRPAAKQVQVLLFLDNGQQSQMIQSWFNNDPKLVHLKSSCDFQVYTSAHPLYRTRYANLVPVDQFPVVLVQDATGGHIHAAGKQFIPRTSAELVGDISRGYELYKQAKQGVIQMTGALKQTGYSWDDQVSPEMRLNFESDCVGPNCPTPTFRPSPRPGGLFDGVGPQKPATLLDDFKSFILQAGIGIIVLLGLGGLAFVCLIAVVGFAIHRSRS